MNREKTTQIVFESLGAPAFYLAKQSVLALYASGRASGIVFSCGYGQSFAVPVYEGFALQHAVSRLDIGGCDLTDFFNRLIGERAYAISTNAEIADGSKCKTEVCYVAENYGRELFRLSAPGMSVETPFELPDEKTVHVDKERFMVPEALFNLSMISFEAGGAHYTLQRSISKCDAEIRRLLHQNIVPAGGSTKYPGFLERLRYEMVSINPPSASINVISSPDPSKSAWVGGSVVASLSTFKDMCISAQEYEETGKRFSIFFTASVFSGALSGLLAGAITGNMEGVQGIRGWRWLYLIEGCCTIAFAICLKFSLLDFPESSKRLCLGERQLAVVRMLHDRQTTVARHSLKLTHWQAIKAALAARTYIFIILFVMDLGSCTISYFIPTIVKSMGYTSVMAQYMTIPIWMVGAVFLVILSYTADATGDRRWHITGCLDLSFICTIVCVTVGNAKVQYAMLCFYIAGLYTALPLILNWTSEVISLPAEKRAVVVALVNSIGNLSAVYGSRLWPVGDGPNFIKGLATTGAFTGFGALLAASIPILLKFLPTEGRTKAERRILEQEEVVLGETDAAART
ncbi:unnamed protein product [Clonostachys rhizophaga]|uniref:Uncharacterized protein n=1 Tax=Clonostachys rhizophaga TaxID=160324 RepID=A0A9N9VLT6_9HYPO|nr:unnamed protein product [Clonostachys rhizophaga]